MALVLTACSADACDGISFTDTTGLYDATTNPTGYGVENDITDPSAFDSYVLRVWKWDLDPANDPYTVELNLQLDVPTPDADDHYLWEFTLAQLGLEEVESGVWYIEAIGMFEGDIYEVNMNPIFTRSLYEELAPKLKEYDPTCPCKKGCENPLDLWQLLQLVRCYGVCSLDKTQRIIAFLKSKIGQCC